MEHIFIDTNVLLRIFNKTSDTLNEVEVLLELVKANQVTLYTTEQVVEEFYRNAEHEIENAISDIAAIPDKVELPRITQQFGEASEILSHFNAIRQAKKALLEAAREAAQGGELREDSLVGEIFAEATELPRTPEIIEKARLRRDLGNPPGKKDTLGDQINWECLLSGVENGKNLSILSRDGDFSVKIGSKSVKQFLESEWEGAKVSKICLFHDLKEFLSEAFPDIKTPLDAKKNSALSKLKKSGSFLTTHKQIAILAEIIDQLSLEEATKAFRALIENEQVRWIATDEDVKEFYSRLFERFYPKTPHELDEELIAVAPYLGPDESDLDDDIPF